MPTLGTHHIRTIDSYIISRRAEDIPLSTHRRAGMIIYNDIDPKKAITAKYDYMSANTCPVSELIKRANIQSHPTTNSCGAESIKVSKEVRKQMDQANAQSDGSIHKRQTGCPAAKVIMAVGVVADCNYISKYGSTQAALKQILANYNSATQIYESSFNFGLGVIAVKMFPVCDGTDNGLPLVFNQICTSTYTINQRLSDFADWRGKKEADSAGLWHLMSTCNSGSTVGIAWLGTACATKSYQQVTAGVTQFVTGVAVSTVVPSEWKVVAHETGHSNFKFKFYNVDFGAIHDCIATYCPLTCTDGDTCVCCPCGPGAACDCGGQFSKHIKTLYLFSYESY